MPTKIQLRRGAASSWTSANPVLSQGELGFETDTGKFKIGDGSTAWNSLGYSAVKPSDLDELAQDAVNTALTAGTGITKTYNDGANTITVAIDSTVTTNSGSQTLTNKTLTSPIVTGLTLNDSSISFEGATPNEFETFLTAADPTADNTITLPDISGTIITTGDTGTVTSTMIADGTIVNSDINSSAAIAATKISGTAVTQADTGTVTSTMIADGTIVNGDINASAAIAATKISGTAVTQADTGTVTSAMIADGTIVNSDINASAAIALSKLATDPLARANHTGTQTASTISDFNTAVRTNRLDQMAVPTASISLNSQKITGLADPTADQDAATKAYVDASTAGLNVHASVRAATTVAGGNINLSTGLVNNTVLDGITLVTGDRVLVKNQTTTSQNGIYIVAASGAASRATDYDATPEVDAGDFIYVESGTVNASTGWVQTNTITTIGTDPIAFTQFSGTGTYTAGTGLTLSGNQFSINTATTADLSTSQTLSNKSISLGSNTITGTTAQFNTALSDGDFATLAGTETLTNKTFTDSTTNFQDNTDTTKKMQFELSGLTTATTRTLTVPNVSGTIITTGDTGTVTNTMLAGSIANNKLTNSTISGVGLGSNLNALTISTGLSGTSYNGGSAVTIAIDSTVATLTGTQTFTNKTFTDSTTSFQDDADNTKKMQFQLSGITSGQTRTLTIPNVSGTIVTTGDTATVSNAMLANSSVTVNGTAISLGSSGTITVPISTGVSGLGTGVATFLATPSSANLISAITDETGSGSLVFGTTPTLSTPVINNPRWGYTTTATAGGTTTLTHTSNYIQIFTGSSNQTVQMPNTNTLAAGQSWEIENNSTGTLTVNSSGGNLIVSINPGHSYAITCIGTTLTTAADWNAEWNGSSTITGTGAAVLATSPTLTTPNLGTPSALTLTNATGLPISGITASTSAALGVGSIELGHATDTTIARSSAGVITVEGVVVPTISSTNTLTNKTINGANNTLTVRIANDVSGLGTGVATFLTTPSSANLISAITDETGSGALVFGTSPTIATPTLTLSTSTSTTEGRIAWNSTEDKIIVGDGTTAREFASSTLITNAQTGTTYTTVLTDKDRMVELNNAAAITLSVPTNASVAYPVGTQIHILQTGAGQVTVAAVTPGTTTINGTPGLKLRAQWSAATLIKRATDTWVLVGDLSA